MQLFNYVALNGAGEQQSGSQEAQDKGQLLESLRQQGLFVIEVSHAHEVGKSELAEDDFRHQLAELGIITNGKKIFFFRQMSLMLNSGLALTECLDMVKEISGGKLGIEVAKISNFIKAGGTFSEAIAEAGIFPNMAEFMIKSAEATGELDIVMGRIADDMVRKADMKRQMLSAMLYPGITMLIAVGMGYLMVTSVIPKFKEQFERMGKQLPPDAQNLVDISDFFTQNGNFILIGIVTFFAMMKFIRSKQKGRYITDRILLSIPVFGKVSRITAMSQLSWGLSSLLQSGLTVVEALRIIEKMIPNSVIAKAVSDATDQVLVGRELGRSLTSPYIEKLVSQLAAVGERSGSLVAIMNEAGNFYEEGLKAMSKTLANLVEPLAILIIGGMVMMVYIGFFKAMMGASG